MGTEDLPQVLVASLGDEVGVHLAECGQVTVGVVTHERVFAVSDGDTIGGNLLAGQGRNPDAAAFVGCRVRTGRGNDVHRVGQARHDANGDARIAQMSAEHGVR